MAESDLVTCGAVVGADHDNTIIVFHPSLTAADRDRYARELLGDGEWAEWRVLAA